MKGAHWPRHFYLIGAGEAAHNVKPCSQSMGSKAFNLLRMLRIGLPIPPALVLGTHFTSSVTDCMLPLYQVGLPALQDAAGLVFGDARRPLIVSVRSGSPVSMPGMMETLLNIGLCDQTLPGLVRRTGNPRLVWDAYRRLIAGYGEVVAGLAPSLFEVELDRVTRGRDERALDFSELRELTRRFQVIYLENARQAFPQDVTEQLWGAVSAVFASWESDKARAYRKLNQLDAAMGTAVTIQAMVFGNSGGHSGAGVGFTRDPTTGEPRLWVDFLANAQGEDVVSGRRNAYGHQTLTRLEPQAWRRLEESARALEREFKDMQDFEFTVQEGVFYLLQTRSGKRTPLAAARIALDLREEGIIDCATALERTSGLREEDLATARVVPRGSSGGQAEPVAEAMPAGPGVATGEIAMDSERALARAGTGANVILVRQDAETSDIAALDSAGGLLTQRGARTSHAAVVARQLGKVCLVGCGSLRIDPASRTVQLGEARFNEGDVITLDGHEGRIYAGAVDSVKVADEELLGRLRALRMLEARNHHGKRHQ